MASPKQKQPSGMHEDCQRANGAMVAKSVDLEAGTMMAVISAESRVQAWDPRVGYCERITLSDGMQFRSANQAPFLDSHDAWSTSKTLGSARGIEVQDGGNGSRVAVSRIHFSKKQIAQDALQDYADGHLTDVSIRLQYELKKTLIIEAGQTKKVGEREFTAGELPLLIVKQCVVPEVSAVGIGADPKARAQMAGMEAAGLREQENSDMSKSKEDEQAAADGGGGGGTATATQAQDTPRVTPAKENVIDLQSERERIRGEERKQVVEVQRLGKQLGLSDAIIQAAVDKGMTAEQAAKHFIEEQAKMAKPLPQNVMQHTEGDDARLSVQSIAGGLVASMGPAFEQTLFDREQRLGKASGEQAEKMIERGRKYWRGIGLQSALFAGIEAVTGRREHNVGEGLRIMKQMMLRDALGLGDAMQGLSGGNLNYIFDVAINTAVLRGWDARQETYAKWTHRTPCKNYLPQELVGLQHTSRIRRRGEGTKAKHQTFKDLKETYRVYEYAGKIKLDQQAIINDNLGLLAKLAMYEGHCARRVVGDAAYATLLNNANMTDGNALFSTAHRNKGTTGSAMSVAAIEAAYDAIAAQYIGSGKDIVNLNNVMKYIIAGTKIAPTAMKAINSQEIKKAGGSSTVTYAPYNILTNYGLEVIPEARINNGFVDPVTDTAIDGDDALWFGCIDPSQGDTVELGFIDALGEEPLMTFEVLGDGEFGVQYIVQITVGAGAAAFEGMYMATGAA